MSRANETRKIIEADRDQFPVSTTDDLRSYLIMRVLGNIAISLAIIADKLTEGDTP